MIQYLSFTIIFYLSLCSSKLNVASMGNRRRYLANNSDNSSQQNSTQDKINSNSSVNIVSKTNPTLAPTSQPSSIFKAPSQDIITEGILLQLLWIYTYT
jgi:hypothetical protein